MAMAKHQLWADLALYLYALRLCLDRPSLRPRTMVYGSEMTAVVSARNGDPEQVWWTGVVDRCGGQVWWTGVVDRCGGQVWWTGVVDRCGGQVWWVTKTQKELQILLTFNLIS